MSDSPHTSRALIDLIGNALSLVPDQWEQLPLPESPKASLGIAVWLLPFYLTETSLPDDELVAFAHNGGWHKIDKLLPLLYHIEPYGLRKEWGGWIGDLRRHTGGLKVSHLALLGYSNLETDHFLACSGPKV